jgi:hypothetical protein
MSPHAVFGGPTRPPLPRVLFTSRNGRGASKCTSSGADPSRTYSRCPSTRMSAYHEHGHRRHALVFAAPDRPRP